MRKLLIALLILWLPLTAFGAIARDTNGGKTNCASSPCTVAFNNAAGTYLLIAVFDFTNGDHSCTMTYNGTAMTGELKQLAFSELKYGYLFALDAPATGSHNIVTTCTGSSDITVYPVSYSGTANPAKDNALSGSVTGTSLSKTVGTTVDNEYGYAWCRGEVNTVTGQTNLTAPISPTAAANPQDMDSNGNLGAASGSTALACSQASAGGMYGVFISFKPAATASTFNPMYFDPF